MFQTYGNKQNIQNNYTSRRRTFFIYFIIIHENQFLCPNIIMKNFEKIDSKPILTTISCLLFQRQNLFTLLRLDQLNYSTKLIQFRIKQSIQMNNNSTLFLRKKFSFILLKFNQWSNKQTDNQEVVHLNHACTLLILVEVQYQRGQNGICLGY
ncbi:unnamed protein product [Paramecium octaurelia]|uniref:Uncharacterized protein n=1 Tax=Paramecium octaurelia TaxID=43137 RepID=A0A8S1Y2V7_PAROT|nr:unnamed protein product [Paramecium octaurelia]